MSEQTYTMKPQDCDCGSPKVTLVCVMSLPTVTPAWSGRAGRRYLTSVAAADVAPGATLAPTQKATVEG